MQQAKFATWKNLPLKYRSNFFECCCCCSWYSSSSAIFTTQPFSSITLVSRRSSVVVVVVVLQNNNNKTKCEKKMELFLVRCVYSVSLEFPDLHHFLLFLSLNRIRVRARDTIASAHENPCQEEKRAFLPLRYRGVLSGQLTNYLLDIAFNMLKYITVVFNIFSSHGTSCTIMIVSRNLNI